MMVQWSVKSEGVLERGQWQWRVVWSVCVGGWGGGGGGWGGVFFFNDTATTEIYTLSLHDALPILSCHLPNNTQAA